jgi:hypothetical protein
MQVNHRILRLVFAFGTGLLVSYWSYQWITNPQRAAERAVEEAVVQESRLVLLSYVADNEAVELSDPLERVRAAGKVYIYPIEDGWEISGQYKRHNDTGWHAFLMRLDKDSRLLSLSVEDNDPDLAIKAAADLKFSVSREN